MNPLQQLNDIITPTSVSPWPPLLVWMLAMVTLITLAALAWWLRRRHQQGALLRQAQAHLDQVDLTRADATSALQQLLRRTALGTYPRERIAGLLGNDWHRFLDSHLPAAQRGQWPTLIGDPYAPPGQQGGDIEALQQHVALVLPKLAKGGQGC